MTENQNATEPATDAWGRPLMQPNDGHSAWGCNNYDCTEHPQSLYGQSDLPECGTCLSTGVVPFTSSPCPKCPRGTDEETDRKVALNG